MKTFQSLNQILSVSIFNLLRFINAYVYLKKANDADENVSNRNETFFNVRPLDLRKRN